MEARWLYTGALFKKALAYTIREFDRVYILSAKYGLVELNQVIAPYDLTLKKFTKTQRLVWTKRLKEQMKRKELFKEELFFFVGQDYGAFLQGHKPIANVPGRFGGRLRWFNQQNQKQGFNL